MPGTIQVSVLGFKSSLSSPTSLKVSMGKRDYQIWDKGDFSFPVTTLREDLKVTLQDADGNEIAQTGVGTMLIVEKGSWDDIFPLEGGGQVHMKLQFFLSEEDRDRIRLMRESAVKKKQHMESTNMAGSSSAHFEEKATVFGEGVPYYVMRIASSPDAEMRIDPIIVTSKNASLLLDPVSECSPLVGPMKHGQKSSETLNRREDYSAPKVLGTEVHITEANQKDDSLHKSEKQERQEKTPSSVRKMISAFESNQTQDTRSLLKTADLKIQGKKVGKRSYMKDQNTKDVAKTKEQPSGLLHDYFVGKNSHNTPTVVSDRTEDIGSVTQAGKKLRNQRLKITELEREEVGIHSMPREAQEENNIGSTSIVRGMNEVLNTKEHVKSPVDITRLSEKTFSERILKVSSGNLDMGILSSNSRCLCITTAGKEVLDLFEKLQLEGNTLPEPESSSKSMEKGKMPHGDIKKKKDNGLFHNLMRNSKSDGSSDVPGGVIGQAIKIAIIVGFGALVFLTRQREPRKAKTEANNQLTDAPGFTSNGAYPEGPIF